MSWGISPAISVRRPVCPHPPPLPPHPANAKAAIAIAYKKNRFMSMLSCLLYSPKIRIIIVLSTAYRILPSRTQRLTQHFEYRVSHLQETVFKQSLKIYCGCVRPKYREKCRALSTIVNLQSGPVRHLRIVLCGWALLVLVGIGSAVDSADTLPNATTESWGEARKLCSPGPTSSLCEAMMDALSGDRSVGLPVASRTRWGGSAGLTRFVGIASAPGERSATTTWTFAQESCGSRNPSMPTVPQFRSRRK